MEPLRDDPLLNAALEVEGYRVLPPCILYGTIGSGGMGNVYRGHHLNLDLEVAIKCLKPSLIADDPQFVERFRREGRSAAKINHPNVIRVFDVVEFAGLHYLIMELVEGESARQRVQRKGALKIDECLQIAYETASGLGEAHRIGIVHRDIKPDNVLISLDGRVKVADLGLAKPTFGGAGGGQSLLSSPDVVIGTPAYMPPEQWEGGAITGAADVWALGATLYYLLTGREAIQGAAPAQIMSKIVLGTFPDVREVRPEVGDDVAGLIAKATAKDPADRFADAEEMARALRALGLAATTLRDIMSGTGELRTMISPPPRNRVELVKRALTDSELGATPTGRAQAKTVESPAKTVVSKRSRDTAKSSKGWWLVGLLAFAAAGTGVWIWKPWDAGAVDPNGGGKGAVVDPGKPPEGPPAADPLAYVNELAEKRQFAEAILVAKGIYRGNPALTDRAERITALCRNLADQREAQGDERGALEALDEALAENVDPTVERQLELRRGEYREGLGVAFADGIVRREPAGPVQRTRGSVSKSVQFAGTIPRARLASEGSQRAVEGFDLGGEAVVLTAEGAFEVNRTLETAMDRVEVPVRVRLVDGSAVDCAPWIVQFVDPEPLQLTFSAPPTPQGLTKGATAAASIELRGELDEADAEIYRVSEAGEERLDARWEGNAFTCSVELEDGDNRIRLVARKPPEWTASVEQTVSVLRLAEPPRVDPVAPASTKAEVPAAKVDVEVACSRGTESVELRGLGKPRPLVREVAEDGTPGGWKIEALPLAAGENAFEIVARDVLGRETVSPWTLTCVAGVSDVRFEVDGEAVTPQAGEPLYTKSRNVALTCRAVPVLGLEVKVRDSSAQADVQVKGDRIRLPLQFRLAPAQGAPTPIEIVADAPEAVARWEGVVVFDDGEPQLVVEPRSAQATLGGMVDVAVRWKDATGLASLTVDGEAREIENAADGSGRWSAKVAAGTESRSVEIVAVDRCGNRATALLPIEIAAAVVDPPEDPPAVDPEPGEPGPGAGAAPKTFATFANVRDTRYNDLGYPLEIEHRRSGIRLVAIGFRDGVAPNLYAAVDLVSEKQWDGAGSDGAKVSISGEDVRDGLAARFDDLRLPTVDEWQRIANSGESRLKNLVGGAAEWLAPAGRFDSNWPIVKTSRDSYRASRGAPNIGFRVVYRPK